MAFPVVEATNTSSESSQESSHTVNLPAGIQAGETLIVLFGLEGQGAVTFPGGWTKFFDKDTDVAGDRKLSCAWRKASGAEGGTITVTTGTTDRSHHQSYRISGATDPTVRAPEATAGVDGSSDSPDPDSLTPTGGAKDYLWLAIAVTGSDTSFSAAPTNYTDLIGTGIGNIWVTPGSARRNLNAASEDPGVFTLPGSLKWVAGTIAIHPPSVAGIASQRLKIGAGR